MQILEMQFKPELLTTSKYWPPFFNGHYFEGDRCTQVLLLVKKLTKKKRNVIKLKVYVIVVA